MCAPGGLDVAIRQPLLASISVLDRTGIGERQPGIRAVDWLTPIDPIQSNIQLTQCALWP